MRKTAPIIRDPNVPAVPPYRRPANSPTLPARSARIGTSSARVGTSSAQRGRTLRTGTGTGFDDARAVHIHRVASDRHSIRKERSRPAFCKPCDRGFPSKKQLDRHLISGPHKRTVERLAGEKKKFHCKICDRKFILEHDFKTHNESRGHLSKLRRSKE